MTKDEIIEMAKEAGGMFDHMMWLNRDLLPVFERFAVLVAEKEREACAKVCDELIAPDVYSDTDVSMWDVTCIDCASAIRARKT